MVFGIFKREGKPRLAPGFGGALIAPVAKAVALGQIAQEHGAAIRAGQTRFPIHKAADASLLEVWRCLRLEACLPALHFGDASLVDLADIGKQRGVLEQFLDAKAHLQSPQPSGPALGQSIQSMWQVYVYLSEVGTELGDPLTDRHRLKGEGKDILSDVEISARKLRADWKAFPEKSDQAIPSTLFDAFLADLNRKSKSIAFAKVFGPFYEREVALFADHLKAELGEADAVVLGRTLEELLRASDPDDAAERTRDAPVHLPLLTG